MATRAGFEPAIFSVTGRRDIRYTNEPQVGHPGNDPGRPERQFYRLLRILSALLSQWSGRVGSNHQFLASKARALSCLATSRRSPARDLNPDLYLRRVPFYPVELTGLVLPQGIKPWPRRSKRRMLFATPRERVYFIVSVVKVLDFRWTVLDSNQRFRFAGAMSSLSTNSPGATPGIRTRNHPLTRRPLYHWSYGGITSCLGRTCRLVRRAQQCRKPRLV